MDIGTAEIANDIEKPKRKRSSLSARSSTGGNGGGRNPGGGGSDKPDEDNPADTNLFVPGKSRILTGFLLLVVLMTFGGLMAAYVVIATNNVAEWRPFALPVQVWISTVLILISSAAYHFGKMAVDQNNQPAAKRWFVSTTVLGAAFISSQVLAWLALVGRGLYVQGNPYVGFFYILTAVHAVHVLGGIAALGAILLRSWHPTQRPDEIIKRQTIAQVVGWYWHLIGALWLVLFILLGFWK
jgi:cytochrome c oxidase subunit 3